jgi:FkbM family methyltransferase
MQFMAVFLQSSLNIESRFIANSLKRCESDSGFKFVIVNKSMKLFKYYINPFLTHPLNRKNKIKAIWGFMKWQLLLRHAKANDSYIIAPYIGHLKIFVKKGLSGITGNLYSGLYEFSEMGFLLHFLQEDDIFIDVGSNVGVYTLLASGVKGATSYCFEPIPQTYSYLKLNTVINNLEHKTFLFNMGVGSEEGNLMFSSDRDAMNSVVDNGYKGKTETVKVVKLDNLLREKITGCTLLKIDTEGFEAAVLEGADHILQDANVKAIIVEMNNREKINEIMVAHGFQSYSYNVFEKALTVENHNAHNNLIYIRDKEFVEQRISNSKSILIKGVPV